jgi:hypothetical protein
MGICMGSHKLVLILILFACELICLCVVELLFLFAIWFGPYLYGYETSVSRLSILVVKTMNGMTSISNYYLPSYGDSMYVHTMRILYLVVMHIFVGL